MRILRDFKIPDFKFPKFKMDGLSNIEEMKVDYDSIQEQQNNKGKKNSKLYEVTNFKTIKDTFINSTTKYAENTLFLEKFNIPYNIINNYTSYHYGYMRDENGNRIITKKLSSDEYKKLYQNEIDVFNKSINKTKIIIDMIDRFIIRGRNADYDIDALVYGTPNDYIYLQY